MDTLPDEIIYASLRSLLENLDQSEIIIFPSFSRNRRPFAKNWFLTNCSNTGSSPCLLKRASKTFAPVSDLPWWLCCGLYTSKNFWPKNGKKSRYSSRNGENTLFLEFLEPNGAFWGHFGAQNRKNFKKNSNFLRLFGERKIQGSSYGSSGVSGQGEGRRGGGGARQGGWPIPPISEPQQILG